MVTWSSLCPLDSDSAGLQLLLHCLGGKLSLSRHHGSGELPCYKETSFTDSSSALCFGVSHCRQLRLCLLFFARHAYHHAQGDRDALALLYPTWPHLSMPLSITDRFGMCCLCFHGTLPFLVIKPILRSDTNHLRCE